MFSHYTESNCELECAWDKAEEVCGCRPWYVPSLDSSKTCFVLGNVCFDQTMKKIEKRKIVPSCQCDDDCIYNIYSISLQQDVILERSAPIVFEYDWNGLIGNTEFGNLGTDALDGYDYETTYWFNMGM